MKYIVITVTTPASSPGDDPFLMRFPFIFPDMMVHAHVAKAQCLLLDLIYPKASKIEATSAGSVNSPDFDGEAYGKSDTLKLASDPSDTLLIRQCDYGSVMTVPATPAPKTSRYRGFLIWLEVIEAGSRPIWVGGAQARRP